MSQQHQTLPEQSFRVHQGAAPCAVDLGDGSERGEYVDQGYIFEVLGRPHRSVNLMYCYYPYDKGWPVRASVAYPPTDKFAWAYPYDDYFPYQGGPNGTTAGEPFNQMKEIRRYGQDVTLTLTIDCSVPDEELAVLAAELKPFGHLRLRINHECDGEWFAFNKRNTRKQIAEFFNRFAAVLKRIAPDIKTVCNFGWLNTETGEAKYIDDLGLMLPVADTWSIDKYLCLHYSWPFNVCEKEQLDKGYSFPGLDYVWNEMHTVYKIFQQRTGMNKPLEICEFNADGDVVGPKGQADLLSSFYRRVIDEKPTFLKGITYYQFRDRGRLGLEREDPSNSKIGQAVPFREQYRELIQHPHFTAAQTWKKREAAAPIELAWTHAEDADGIGWEIPLKARPTFFELKLPKAASLLIQVGQRWYYKAAGVEWIDATGATEESKAGDIIKVAIFAPPVDGTNLQNGQYSSTIRTTLAAPPELRVRYE